MKTQAWQGNWKTLLIRLFVGAFLPALAAYSALYFLLSLRMTSSEASWIAIIISVCVWNYCNYKLGYTDLQNTASQSSDDETYVTYDPYDHRSRGFDPFHTNSQFNTIKSLSSRDDY